VSHLLPRSFADASSHELSRVEGICLDIDDTLSTDGKLEADAYAALWRLKQARFRLVPITGRPAGWCDLIARFWPVDAVVGENGAFTFYMEKSETTGLVLRKRLDTPKGDSDLVLQEKLKRLREEIQSQFPQARVASDQAYREYDLAIDICEDVPAWKAPEVERLLDFCKARGAHAKLSSIHVNIWFGDYDKKKGFDTWLNCAQKTGAPRIENWLYIGDSPNDEPLFATFQQSLGVANLKKYLDRLQSLPTWITSQPCGAGFVEMADRLIAMRSRERGE